jgi:hypothetical protein
VERTPSEAASEDDFMVPLEANDRDHEFSNPAKALRFALPQVGGSLHVIWDLVGGQNCQKKMTD